MVIGVVVNQALDKWIALEELTSREVVVPPPAVLPQAGNPADRHPGTNPFTYDYDEGDD